MGVEYIYIYNLSSFHLKPYPFFTSVMISLTMKHNLEYNIPKIQQEFILLSKNKFDFGY